MTLTHQFLITLALPATFLVVLVYDWRNDGSRQYGPYWSLTLLVAALWASSPLSYYGGVALPAEIAFTWRIAGNHLLSALALCMLLTTTAYLGTERTSRALLLGISALFWIASLMLDPAIWPWRMPAWSFNAQENAHFNLWAAVWVTAWVVPLLGAIMLARQASRETQSALFRNRLNYWTTMLLIVSFGGALALIQQPGQPAWQELGALALALAAILGTTVFVRNTMPNLRLALKHAVARLAASLLILALTWLFLFLIVQILRAQVQPESTVLELGLAAAIFTVLFGAINRYVPRLVRRFLLPDGRHRSGALADHPALTEALSDPAALGQILLHLCQFNVSAESVRLLVVEERQDEAIRLRSLAQLGCDDEGQPVEFDKSGPVLTYLRRQPPMPLSAHELASLPAFATMTTEERRHLWQNNTEILMPLLAGDTLVGALALGEKYTAEAYSYTDLTWLQEISVQVGLLLWQALQLQQCMTKLESVQIESRERYRETRHLRELRTLHERFAHHISPALRQPFQEIDQTLKELQSHEATNGATATIGALNQQLARLRLTLNTLIINATRIRRHHGFSFQDVNLADVIDEAVRDLASMAQARQVAVAVSGDTHLLHISGDHRRLYDAVHHLLHNAIRFNKIGGRVDVQSGISGENVFVHVHDTGIGIAQQHLAQIWEGPDLNHDGQPGSANSGMSLLLTRFIVRAHGGEVKAESDVDNGSTFSLYLPLAARESYDAALA